MTTGQHRTPRATRSSVLVLGDYRPTLTVARRLSEAGHHVIVGEGRHGAAGARYSRFVDEMWSHPPLGPDGAFGHALRRLVAERADIVAVFPVEEPFSVWLADNGASLPERITIVSPAPAVVRTCLDKVAMLDLAGRLGVRCLPHASVGSLAELRAAASRVGFPLIVRPFSHLVRLGTKKAVICWNEAELDAAFPRWPANQRGLLVQRYARGERRDLYFIARDGAVDALVETRITRTDHPDGTGLSTEGQYVPVTPALATETRRLVAALGYRGIGFAQFILDPKTGAATFLEINPRTAGSHRCAEAAGMPLTMGALSIARHGRAAGPFPPPRPPIGGYYCWLSGDLHGLKEALRHGDIGPQGALRWGWRMLRSALRARVHLTFTLADPLPALALLARPVAELGRRRVGRKLRHQLPPHGGVQHDACQSAREPGFVAMLMTFRMARRLP